jgi:Tol biopolymer transport system component
VFGARHDGAWELYTTSAPGAPYVVIGNAGDGNAPDWSPDGNHIAFKSGRTAHDGIYIADAHGATVHLLVGDDAHDANNPKWSPYGQHIAFMWDRDGRTICLSSMRVAKRR